MEDLAEVPAVPVATAVMAQFSEAAEDVIIIRLATCQLVRVAMGEYTVAEEVLVPRYQMSVSVAQVGHMVATAVTANPMEQQELIQCRLKTPCLREQD